MIGGLDDGMIFRNTNEPAAIILMPENPNKVVLASIKDIPNALYSLEVEVKLKPKNNSLPVYKTYSNATKISIINEDLLEILKVPGDVHASLIYLHLCDIENFDIKFVCDTDADGETIDRKLWNIKEDKDNVN